MVFIPRLTSEQSGIYTCIVENSIGRVNQSIYLDIQCKFRSKNNRIFMSNNFQMHRAFELLNLVSSSIVLIPPSFAVLSMRIPSSMKSNGLKIILKYFVKIHQRIYISIELNVMIPVYIPVLPIIVFIIIKSTMVQIPLNFLFKVDRLSKQHIQKLQQKSVNQLH